MEKLQHHLDILIDALQIKEVKTHNALDALLSITTHPLKPSFQEIFDILLEEINDKGDQWNEEELKMKFIAFLLFIAEIEEKGKIQAFYERPLAAVINGHKINVKTDCMVATPLGKNTPREPYFFLQEFKKSKGDKFDPEAQMLAAMAIAQEQNTKAIPIYGAFVVGKNWVFSVLKGTAYCRSRQYDASEKDELLDIVFILRKLKTLIQASIA
jgi:hypothetical protein